MTLVADVFEAVTYRVKMLETGCPSARVGSTPEQYSKSVVTRVHRGAHHTAGTHTLHGITIPHQGVPLTDTDSRNRRQTTLGYMESDYATPGSNPKPGYVARDHHEGLSSQNMSFTWTNPDTKGSLNVPCERMRRRRRRRGMEVPLWLCVVSLSVCVLGLVPFGLCFNVDMRTNVLHQSLLGSMFGFTVDQYREAGTNW